jgi:hypothetical protein
MAQLTKKQIKGIRKVVKDDTSTIVRIFQDLLGKEDWIEDDVFMIHYLKHRGLDNSVMNILGCHQNFNKIDDPQTLDKLSVIQNRIMDSITNPGPAVEFVVYKLTESDKREFMDRTYNTVEDQVAFFEMIQSALDSDDWSADQILTTRLWMQQGFERSLVNLFREKANHPEFLDLFDIPDLDLSPIVDSVQYSQVQNNLMNELAEVGDREVDD